MQMRPKETSSYPYFSLECHVILTDKAFDHLSLEICYTLNYNDILSIIHYCILTCMVACMNNRSPTFIYSQFLTI